MNRLLLILLFTIISNQSICQIIKLDKAIIYVFRIDKNAKRQFNETNYWIAQSDNSSFIRLDFREIYEHSEIVKCSKGDTLKSPFATVWESHWLKEGAEVEKEVFSGSKYLIQNFTSDGDNVSVYRISMSGQFCKCSFRDSDGEIIPLYIPLKEISFGLATGIKTDSDLSKFEFHFRRDRN